MRVLHVRVFLLLICFRCIEAIRSIAQKAQPA
nr:MAG TPA: hypothetical protein [Microviridae sp.]DAR43201.1 MAG TPA: hypothetical protein [Microviridae sp.]